MELKCDNFIMVAITTLQALALRVLKLPKFYFSTPNNNKKHVTLKMLNLKKRIKCGFMFFL